ncbi:DUF3050 domain-containing protein [Brasilonema sp. UFV-L1]|uniref:DUF3050 domain-containing protein n=1 Tax=Brasilonema sp. UFV-L1 TaxID=2234130 RepID=UPI00145F1985|nr:DUF3050 domain-containing protein [Brasilonema sp. UFV-L1]NMG05923.1 hypothetical protein [Brasilonema sp. UFV-L1]
MSDRYLQLIDFIYPLKHHLVNHRVYTELVDLYSLQIFMESHSFAVWDFMCLVKTLQRKLTCVTVPWLPPKDIFSARLINDIVLAEETDEVSPGVFISHFDLYLAGMREIGANTIPIQSFIEQLQNGKSVQYALDSVTIPSATKGFVLSTMKATSKLIHEVAANFLFGREDVIPFMFQRILKSLDNSRFNCQQLSLYLERHTHLDEDVHGPMGEQLLKNLCGDDDEKWEQSAIAAQEALLFRISLWDGVVLHILNGKRKTRGSLTRLTL